jgi:hypothetical protein
MTTQAARVIRLQTAPVPSPIDAADSRLKKFVQDRRGRMTTPGDDFEEFEKELHRRVMEVERELLAGEMAAADVDVEAIVLEGTTFRRVLRSEETYISAAGEVRVMRTLYKDRSDSGRAISPMELRLGVVEGLWTPHAAKQGMWLVAQMTPKLGEQLCARVGNMTPSKSSLDRLPKAIHDRWEDDRAALETALREVTKVPDGAVSMAVSIDGVLAPMKDTDPVATRTKTAGRGQIAKGPAGYREIGCATISFCNAEGRMLSAIRFARMPEPKKASLKRSLLAEVTDVLEQRPHLKVVKVADGAHDNWSFLAHEMPAGPEVVDFFHAAEHLNAALADVYGDGTVEARRRFATLRHVLLEEEGGAAKVIRALDYLRRNHPRCTRLATELAYFRKHRRRMKYAELRAQGFPVGSGIVEAACKTLVAQRMKQSGMRWGHEGGQAILNVRGWSQSDRFDQAWALIAATYKVEVTLLNNVVSIRRDGR